MARVARKESEGSADNRHYDRLLFRHPLRPNALPHMEGLRSCPRRSSSRHCSGSEDKSG